MMIDNDNKSAKKVKSDKSGMSQLTLTIEQLEEIGFKKHISPGDDMNDEKILYKIDFINGFFYYNINDEKYRWYHVTEIGDNSNYIHLNITTINALFYLLSSFGVEFDRMFFIKRISKS